jgi:hypothetical protein
MGQVPLLDANAPVAKSFRLPCQPRVPVSGCHFSAWDTISHGFPWKQIHNSGVVISASLIVAKYQQPTDGVLYRSLTADWQKCM